MKQTILRGLSSLLAVGLLAGCGNTVSTDAPAATEVPPATTPDSISLSVSWWGNDARSEAYQNALSAYLEDHTWVSVTTVSAPWTGWQDLQATALQDGTASDLIQVTPDMLVALGGSSFADMNTLSGAVHLDSFSDGALAACTVDGTLRALPLASSGRVFYWNRSIFDQAEISLPQTLEELLAAGALFKERLGDDYYPLALDANDRAALLIAYLAHTYDKPLLQDNTLQYTPEELTDGLSFLQSLEDSHVIPALSKMYESNYASLDASDEWKDGRYAGIWEWDSAALRYRDALADPSSLAIGTITADAPLTYTKCASALTIPASCQHASEAASLAEFLLNGDGAALLGTACGFLDSAEGYLPSTAEADPLLTEAHEKAMGAPAVMVDPILETDALVGSHGILTSIIQSCSGSGSSAERNGQTLYDELTAHFSGETASDAPEAAS